MPEPIYQYVRGMGWVPKPNGQTVKLSDYFDKYDGTDKCCLLCGKLMGKHFSNNGTISCSYNGTLGLFDV